MALLCFFSLKRTLGIQAFLPSRLFIYYNARMLAGYAADAHLFGTRGAGITLPQGVRAIQKFGFCPESSWPYDVSKLNTWPPPSLYQEACNYRMQNFQNLPLDFRQLKKHLSTKGPFAFSIPIFKKFQTISKDNLHIRLPKSATKPVANHSLLAIGYDDRERLFIVQNSMGREWGNQGKAFLPYGYLEKYAFDAIGLR